MNAALWLLAGFVAWFAVSLVVGLLLGPVLRRRNRELGGDDD